MLYNVPYFLLSRVEGAYNVTIYVLFPYLVIAQEKFVLLTKEQLT